MHLPYVRKIFEGCVTAMACSFRHKIADLAPMRLQQRHQRCAHPRRSNLDIERDDLRQAAGAAPQRPGELLCRLFGLLPLVSGLCSDDTLNSAAPLG